MQRLICLYTVLLHFLLRDSKAFTSKVIAHLLHLKKWKNKALILNEFDKSHFKCIDFLSAYHSRAIVPVCSGCDYAE